MYIKTNIYLLIIILWFFHRYWALSKLYIYWSVSNPQSEIVTTNTVIIYIYMCVCVCFLKTVVFTFWIVTRNFSPLYIGIYKCVCVCVCESLCVWVWVSVCVSVFLKTIVDFNKLNTVIKVTSSWRQKVLKNYRKTILSTKFRQLKTIVTANSSRNILNLKPTSFIAPTPCVRFPLGPVARVARPNLFWIKYNDPSYRTVRFYARGGK